MKTVVSTDQIAHLWANQSQEHARNSSRNFFFRGPAIYSYREGFCIAVFSPWIVNGERIVFFNGTRASKTTNRHDSSARRALNGHPVRIVTLHGAASNYAHYGAAIDSTLAGKLARGDMGALRDCIARGAIDARDTLAAALRRRTESYALRGIETAAEKYETLRALCALAKTKRDCSRLVAALGNVPEIPAGLSTVDNEYGYARTVPAANFRELIAPLAAAMRAETARAELSSGYAAKQLREKWKVARDSTSSARCRYEYAKDCLARARSVAMVARRGGIELPRGLPSVEQCEAMAARLEPAAARQWIADNARHVAAARREMLASYYATRRALHRGEYVYREFADAKAKLLQRVEPQFIAIVRALDSLAESGAVPAGDNYSELFRIAARIAAGSDRKAREYRAALRDLRAAVAEFDTVAEFVRPKIARYELRYELERAHACAVRDIETARKLALGETAPDIPVGNVVAYARGVLETAESRARDYATAYAAAAGLNGGMPERFDIAGLVAARATIEMTANIAAARAQYAAAEKLANDAQAARESGRYFSAMDLACDARKSLDLYRGHVAAIAAAGSVPDDLADPAEAIRAADDWRAALNADMPADPRAIVDCWRRGDNKAREHIGYSRGPVFRIAANGEIESSMGARVSVAAGRLLWRMIRRAVQSGRAVEFEYGKGPHIGAFQLRTIGADGSAVVGCHTISATEAREFAAFMRWPEIDAAPEIDAENCAA